LVDEDDTAKLIVSSRVPAAASTRAIDIPVDSSVRSLLVAIESLPGFNATLRRPDGAGVGDADPDVRLSNVRTMDLLRQTRADLRVYTIARPQSGVWQVIVAGAAAPAGSSALVRASGISPVAFGSFEFVRRQDGVHGGYLPIDGMPLAGVPAVALAQLWNGPDQAAFRLVDETGTTLKTVPLRKGEPDAAQDEFLGSFELPIVPFHVVMDAVGPGGTPIQRQYAGAFQAQTVAVFFDYFGPNVVQPGKRTKFSFAVTNVGTEPATFTLDAGVTLGDISDLSARPVTVKPGTSITTSFWLAVPATVDRMGTPEVRVRLAAINTSDPSLANSAIARLELAREGDADNDFVEDGKDNCRDVPNADQRDANNNGVGDACDPASGGRVTIRTLSPESGPPGTVVRISGTGFSAAESSGILLNGRPVRAAVASPTELTVSIPVDAPLGPATVVFVSDTGYAMSVVPFIVRPASNRR